MGLCKPTIEMVGGDSGGGNFKFGIITPTENTQTITIEHNFGSTEYNFYAILAVTNIESYSKSLISAHAISISPSQSYSTYSFEYSASTVSKKMGLSNSRYGELYVEPPITNDPNILTLATNVNGYLYSSTYTNVIFKKGVPYFWIVGTI